MSLTRPKKHDMVYSAMCENYGEDRMLLAPPRLECFSHGVIIVSMSTNLHLPVLGSVSSEIILRGWIQNVSQRSSVFRGRLFGK